jgi:hypothetical protein
MLFRVLGHVMGHLGLFVFWVWALITFDGVVLNSARELVGV